MTQSTSGPIRKPASLAPAAMMAALLAAHALPAFAQASASQTGASQANTWRSPDAAPVPPRKPVTSSLGATAPTPAEQRQARTLAAALFARPAAAAAAVDKAVPITQADATPVEPKPEWENKGLRFGGKGLLFKSPF
jgi:hypothetical protein